MISKFFPGRSFIKANSILFAIIILSCISFLLIQLFKVHNSGIGTDEGNFLYVIRLLEDGGVLFRDFYSRESGALLLLFPFFQLFETSITNLRYLVVLIHFLTLLFLFLSLQKIHKSTLTNIAFTIISAIIMSFGGPLEIYTGIFYQLFSLFSTLLLYLTLTLRENTVKYALLGLVTGLSILNYKAGQVFLLLIPLLLFLKSDNRIVYIKNNIIFFSVSFFVIILYWIYYSLQTNLTTIYNLVIGDVVTNFLLAFFSAIAGVFLLRSIFNRVDILATLAALLFFFGVFYQFLLGSYEVLPNSFYGGLILQFSFILIFFQVICLAMTGPYSRSVAAGFLICNVTLLFLGYGHRAFFTQVPEWIHIVATSIFILYNLLLITIFNRPHLRLFLGNSFLNKGLLVYTCLFLAFYFVINSLYGGYLMPTRFSLTLVFLPILLSIFYSTTGTKLIKNIFLGLFFISIIFSIFLNATLKNDFTLYSMSQFKEAVDYLNNEIQPESVIFSTDTAVLVHTKGGNLIRFYSPWQFSNQEVNVCGQHQEIQESDVCLRYEDMISIIQKRSPEYIFGSWRHTFRLFETSTGQNLLESNYKLLTDESSIIYLYEKTN